MSSSFPCSLREIQELIKQCGNISELWDLKFDVPEFNNSNLGGLQKNRILGIFLWTKEKEKNSITTNEIKKEFEKFFNIEISRSNVSTYLNQLTHEGVLEKEKKGKIVDYKISHDPPMLFNRQPFWVVYNFCIYPSYVCRLSFFANKLTMAKVRNKEEMHVMELICINTIINRLDKCSICKYGNKEKHLKLKLQAEEYFKDKTKLIPNELKVYIEKLAELEIFGGEKIFSILNWPKITGKIMYFASKYKENLKNQEVLDQRMVEMKAT
ncbi:MAG: transcriptional regulator [Candidatus Lokiarchaeota archaeon]|nr:transcriptional regulator [Candidatus Lokiarchaeota archaeon]